MRKRRPEKDSFRTAEKWKKQRKKRFLAVLMTITTLVTYSHVAAFAVEEPLSETVNEETFISEINDDEMAIADDVNESGAPVEAFAGGIRLTKSFTCNSKGYRLSLPSDASFSSDSGDFDARVTTNGCILQITKEWSPYLNPANDLAEGISQVIPDFQWKD